MMIKYKSYESVNGVSFGSSEGEVIKIFGSPIMKTVDNKGNSILVYKNFAVSLDKNGDFFYFSLYPESMAKVNDIPIGWKFSEIKKFIGMNGDTTEDSGFLILRDLGVAFVDFHNSEDDDMSDKVIVFFRKGTFDHPTKYERPFTIATSHGGQSE